MIPVAVRAQTIAFLTPDKAESSKAFANKLTEVSKANLKVLDDSLAESAYLSVSPSTPFNLTISEAIRIGTAIGCDVFVLVKSATQRRSAFRRAEYYESYATIFVVSARSGRLVFWKLHKFEAPNGERSARQLAESAPELASEIEAAVRSSIRNEINEANPPPMAELPEENTQVAKVTRSPIPYRRLKPEYTPQASLYDVKATVDLMVYLDDKGTIVHTETVRWAGFGLDESVEKNVRSMNWRPAERDGKPLAMKFLVRYNFKKAE